MGAGQSTEGADPQTTAQLQAIAQKYAKTLQQISQLEKLQSSQLGNLKTHQNNLKTQRNALEKEKTNFRAQINILIQDYQKKVNQQQGRNQVLNQREQNLTKKLGEIQATATQNTQTLEQRKTAEIEKIKEEVAALKSQKEGEIQTELAPLSAELNSKKQELASLRTNTNTTAKNLNAKRQELSALQTTANTKAQESQVLNSAITEKTRSLAELEAQFAQKSTELQAAYDLNSQQKVEHLRITLDGIRDQQMAELKKQREEAEAVLADEKLIFQQALLAEKQAFEAEQQKTVEADLAKIQTERGQLDQQRIATEQEIQRLQNSTSLSQQAANNVQRKKQELAGLQEQQVQLEQERLALEESKKQSAIEIQDARQEVEKARAEKIAADAELQKAILAQQKAEAIEGYRKQVYQIIKDWIEPLKVKKQIQVYHDDQTDDYFFQKGTDRKSWPQEHTLREIGIQWQPRPEKPMILTQTGGKRHGSKKNKTRRNTGKKW
jgi:chromosome segregation ATPase